MKHTETEKAIWKAHMSSLAKKVKAMDENEKIAFVGRNRIITVEGHHLSLRNTCLLLFQAGDFTPVQVGGFRQWSKAGRQVCKGNHACGYIMVPIGITKDDQGNEDDSDIRFRWVPVFDVSQTEVVSENAA